MSHIFWDIETSGIDKAFDQILQFAAIRTDEHLNEVDRFEIRSRLSPHIVPSPGALRVTGMTIDQLFDPALPSHYEMVCRLRGWLHGHCPSVFIAYNGHSFDEEFLRQAFWQCLHPPYLTNTGGSSRSDLLKLVRSVCILDPEVLVTPKDDKGNAVLKLDQLAPANGFAHLNAHDALADVQATIFIARLIKDRRPDLWDTFLRFSRKETVTRFVDEHHCFLMLEGRTAKGGGVIATKIAAHPDQSGCFVCFDLSVDQSELEGLDEDKLAKRLARYPKPLRKLKANSSPLLLPLEEAPLHVFGDIGADEFRTRAVTLRANGGRIERLVSTFLGHETTYPASPHVEQQIYDGFPSSADQRLMARFHDADWPDRLDIASRFEDRRLRLLAKRIIFFEQPKLLRDNERRAFEVGMARRMLGQGDEIGSWTTFEKARDELEQMIASRREWAGGQVVLSKLISMQAECEKAWREAD